MAAMAPRGLVRERGSSMRRPAVTRSLTGAAACGVAGAAAGALIVCANPDATQAQTHTETIRNVAKMRFIRTLLNMLDRRADRGFPQTLAPGRQRCSHQL